MTETRSLLRSSLPPFLSLTLVLVLAGCAGTPEPATPADYVFTNGKVYTVDTKNSWADSRSRASSTRNIGLLKRG